MKEVHIDSEAFREQVLGLIVRVTYTFDPEDRPELEALIERIRPKSARYKNSKAPDGGDFLEWLLHHAQMYLGEHAWNGDYHTFRDDRRNVRVAALATMVSVMAGEVRMEDAFAEVMAHGVLFFMYEALREQPSGRFRLTPGIASIFACTDVRVPGTVVRLPFSNTIIDLPDGRISMIDLAEERPFDCRTILVREFVLDGVRALKMMLLGGTVNDLRSREIRNIKLTDQSFTESILFDDAARASGYSHEQIREALHLVANTLLYCTNRKADVIPHNEADIERLRRKTDRHPAGSKKRKRASEKLRQERSRSIYIVGSSFRIEDDDLREAITEGRRLSARHLVRGHWKNQVHGPGRKERREVFIQPYLRGPDLAEVVRRDYVVDVPPGDGTVES